MCAWAKTIYIERKHTQAQYTAVSSPHMHIDLDQASKLPLIHAWNMSASIIISRKHTQTLRLYPLLVFYSLAASIRVRSPPAVKLTRCFSLKTSASMSGCLRTDGQPANSGWAGMLLRLRQGNLAKLWFPQIRVSSGWKRSSLPWRRLFVCCCRLMFL